MTLILFFLISIGFIIYIFLQILSIFTTDAPFVPVPSFAEDEILKCFSFTPNSVLYDLGCGNAKVLIRAVKENPEIKAVGVDIGFIPYLTARFRARNYSNILIRRGNIFETNISEATHIFLYLYPEVISKLIHRIRKQCKPGTQIVSCDFQITGEVPTRVVDLRPDAARGKKLFIYEI